MKTFFGAIADDFTGASDLAGLLARSGAEVSLRIGVPKIPPKDTAPLEVVALKCRTAPVDEAVSEALAAFDWLRQAGAQRFFWKYCSTFDSTPHGNIGPVAEALMQVLGTRQTIYCPAFPENGRSVFMGNLFVGEQLLAESPMKDHPLTPMRDSNLMRLLGPQVTRKVGLANRLVVAKGPSALRARLAEMEAAGFAHVVVDAVANEDLAIIAIACSDWKLLTGGSALAMPLPDIWMQQGELSKRQNRKNRESAAGPAIILSGSCSSMTNRQVANYLERGEPAFRLDPLELTREGVAPVLDWLKGIFSAATPIIYATASPEAVRAAQEALGVARASTLVEDALAACAVKARELGASRFVVAGGETSGAVAKALGVTQLDIGREIAPGVPWCYATSDGNVIAIALKSGNFGDEAFFTKALEMRE